MKRTQLRRKTPMRRSSQMRSGKWTKYRSRPRDIAYMTWVRQQSCHADWMSGCSGNVEADHAGHRGVGRKATDDTCIPLCQRHHRQRTDFSGPFKGWNKAMMRGWLDGAITRYQRDYAVVQEYRWIRARPGYTHRLLHE